jgi:hypothetical protein
VSISSDKLLMPVLTSDNKYAVLECKAPTAKNDLAVPVMLSDGKYASIKVVGVTKEHELGFVALLADGRYALVKPLIGDNLLYRFWRYGGTNPHTSQPLQILDSESVSQAIVDISMNYFWRVNTSLSNSYIFLTDGGDIYLTGLNITGQVKYNLGIYKAKLIPEIMNTRDGDISKEICFVATDNSVKCLLEFYGIVDVDGVNNPASLHQGDYFGGIENGVFMTWKEGQKTGLSGSGDDYGLSMIGGKFTSVSVNSKYSVPYISSGFSFGNDFLEGFDYSLVSCTDKTAWSWGRRAVGQGIPYGPIGLTEPPAVIGMNNWVEPARINGLENVEQVMTDGFFSLARLTNGTVARLTQIPIEHIGIYNCAKLQHQSFTTEDGETRHLVLQASNGSNTGKYGVVQYINSTGKDTGQVAIVNSAITETPTPTYWVWAEYFDLVDMEYKVQFSGTSRKEIIGWDLHGTTYYGTTYQTFAGTGVDDCFIDMAYPIGSGAAANVESGLVKIRIATSGAPDKYEYSLNGGSTWTGNYNITGGYQLIRLFPSNIETGIAIQFSSTTGHTIGDTWTIAQPKASGSPSSPTIYYYWHTHWQYSDDVENDTDGGWITPYIIGKSTIGKVYDWTRSDPHDSSKCTTTDTVPSSPDDPDESFIVWESSYDCSSAEWFVYCDYVRRSLRGRFYKFPSFPSGYSYYYSTNVSGEYDWQESQIAGVYEKAISGFPPQSMPSPPSATPICYYYWVAEWYGDQWYLYLYGADSTGPASDWSCEYYEEWDYATCWRYTTSNSQPADPPNPPWV